MIKEVQLWLFVSKSSIFLMFIKLSSYSNLTTQIFVISLHVVCLLCLLFHYIFHSISLCRSKIDQARVAFYQSKSCICLNFHPLGKMENFIQSDCFCRCTTVTAVPSLSIDGNLVIEISGLVCKKKITPKSQITGRGEGGLISEVGPEI